MRELSQLREEIDHVDADMRALLEERLLLAAEVAEYKRHTKKPIYDRQREAEKIRALTADIDDALLKKSVTEMFKQLMVLSRRKQYALLADQKSFFEHGFTARDTFDYADKTIAYQGVEGAYSHAAGMAYFGETKGRIHKESFRETIALLAFGQADYAILPIENSTAGSVEDVYDVLLDFDVTIIGEYILPIEHALLGVPGASLSDITHVYSHPQAIRQCGKFLSDKNITAVFESNTAIAARKIHDAKDKTKAAICAKINASIYDLSVLAEQIQDESDNKTRFIILSAKKEFRCDAKKLSLTFELPHERGSLYDTLALLSYNDLNLSLIESRPVRGKNWEYRFFIDVEGNLEDERVKNAVSCLKEETIGFRILGNY